MKVQLIIAFCLFFSIMCFPQAGTIDNTFGEKGKVYTDVFGHCFATALQPDGKILAGGIGHYVFTLIRYLPDGSLDSSFGSGGIDSIANSSGLSDIEVLENGKIIASSGLHFDITVVKLKPDGARDSAFGDNGIATVDFGDWETAYTVQVQADGKIVLAGNVTEDENHIYGLLVRLNADGSLDETFGDNGKVKNVFTYQFNCLALQDDGKIVTGGQVDRPEGGTEDRFVMSRYDRNGNLDNSFGTGGTVFTDISNGNDIVYAISISSDGKILAAGTANDRLSTEKSYMSVVKYNEDGTLDKTFGEKAVAKIIFEDKAAEGRSLLVQSDGKLIITGTVQTTQYTDDNDFALARLQVNGSLDSSFGINGEQITQINDIETSRSALLQEDGKIILAGTAQIDGGVIVDYLLIRYNNDAVMPLHFTYFNAAPTNNGGIVLNWQTAEENNNSYFAVQRSTNTTTNFTELTRVNSKGNSSQLQTYSYTDNTPLQGTNFYRLKQVDKDGKFSYSQIVSATVQNGLTVVLYPNPVKDVLNIKGLDAGMSYELKIINIKGSVVAKTSINNTSSYKWNFSSLSKGVYYLRVISNNKKVTVKFAKE